MADSIREHEEENVDVDCEKCRYAAEGSGNTVCCCYYGSDDTEPYGKCEQFEPKEENTDE